MYTDELQKTPGRVAVPGIAAGLALVVAVATLHGPALLATAVLATVVGGVAWTFTWLVDLHHARAARVALLAAGVTTALATMLGTVATAIGPGTVPVVGVLALAASVAVAAATRVARSGGAR